MNISVLLYFDQINKHKILLLKPWKIINIPNFWPVIISQQYLWRVRFGAVTFCAFWTANLFHLEGEREVGRWCVPRMWISNFYRSLIDPANIHHIRPHLEVEKKMSATLFHIQMSSILYQNSKAPSYQFLRAHQYPWCKTLCCRLLQQSYFWSIWSGWCDTPPLNMDSSHDLSMWYSVLWNPDCSWCCFHCEGWIRISQKFVCFSSTPFKSLQITEQVCETYRVALIWATWPSLFRLHVQKHWKEPP